MRQLTIQERHATWTIDAGIDSWVIRCSSTYPVSISVRTDMSSLKISVNISNN